MGGKLIIIAGCLAAGKSTFARYLSRELLIPCFAVDTTDFERVDFGKYIQMARAFLCLPDEMEREGPRI